MSIARGPWRDPLAIAAELELEALDRVEQLERLERRLDEHAGVQEARLLEHLADRIGVVGRGAGGHRHPRGGQGVDGRLQLGAAIAEVRAESEQARVHRRVVSRPAAATLSPMAWANGTSADSGRSMTVKSAIRPWASMRSRSMPSISLPATDARKISPGHAVGLELVGVAEVGEHLQRPPPSSRSDRVAADERMKGDGAVKDDVRREQLGDAQPSLLRSTA